MSKISIIYASKHGTTEKVAHAIAEKLSQTSEVELFSLKQNLNPDISRFETVILGTSIYMGQPSEKMKAFCKVNDSALLQKKTGLFVCGMHPEKEQQEKELKDAFSETLREKATATTFMGGEFLFDKMNFFERFIAKIVGKTNHSVHRIDWNAVDGFVGAIQ